MMKMTAHYHLYYTRNRTQQDLYSVLGIDFVCQNNLNSGPPLVVGIRVALVVDDLAVIAAVHWTPSSALQKTVCKEWIVE